jgi:thiamine biosynthesis lipoprotein
VSQVDEAVAPRLPGAGPERPRLTRRAFVEQIMGMPISVHVRGQAGLPQTASQTDIQTDIAVAQVFATLRRVDAVFSTYRDDSDLMKVRRGVLDPQDAHPWLAEVQELCALAERRTAGLFSAAYDADAGYDPTGLVKGWAVERAARHLEHLPSISFCINAGGDILAGVGAGPVTAPAWRLGIEDPGDRSRVEAVVPLHTGGLATSGSAARGAHVVDPRSGLPVSRPGSASVWGPSLVWADVWATAVYVDPAQGRAALHEQDPAYRCLVL